MQILEELARTQPTTTPSSNGIGNVLPMEVLQCDWGAQEVTSALIIVTYYDK